MAKLPIVVLISGQGTNLQAIITASYQDLAVDIRAVISNRATAYGLIRAQEANIPTHVIAHQDYSQRIKFEQALQQQIDAYQPAVVVLAGFMRKLGHCFVGHYAGRMINIHPSLLPKYPGLHTHERVLATNDKMHGATVHFVTAEVDGGPVICQARLKIRPNETAAHLQKRVRALEHVLFPQVLRWLSVGRLKLLGDTVQLDGKILPQTGKEIFI